MMAETTIASPEPDNNNCPMHDRYNLTCGTCNGHPNSGKEETCTAINVEGQTAYP